MIKGSLVFSWKTRPLNCAMCRCSSCVGRKSSWAEILSGRVATWVTQDWRHASRDRERAEKFRKIRIILYQNTQNKSSTKNCTLPISSQSVSQTFFSFSYLQPSHRHRQQCPRRGPQAAAARRPHTAPCTPPSAAESRSHKLSTCLPPASSQRRLRAGEQRRTGPETKTECTLKLERLQH